MSYATEFVKYILSNKIKSFTHRDILLVTGTNCPYSVLKRGIKPLLEKLGFILTVIDEKKNNKSYSRYIIEDSK